MRNKDRRAEDDFEDDILEDGPTRTFVSDSTTSTDYTIYIDDNVSDPNKYREDLEIIKTAEEDDIITFYFNTRGGDLTTALAFMEAMRATKALTVAQIGPECASAGSMMALACKRWVVSDYSSMMIHTVKYGAYGKDVDVKRQVDFEHKRTKRLWHEIYKDFLTAAEIDSVLTNGEEIWLGATDLKLRFERLVTSKGGKSEMVDVEVDFAETDPLTWPEGSIVKFIKALTPFKKGELAAIVGFIPTTALGEVIEIASEDKMLLLLPYQFDRIAFVDDGDVEDDED